MNRQFPSVCPSCAARLPRAAANRCPLCRHVLEGVAPIIRISCRRCGNALAQRRNASIVCERCRRIRPSRLMQGVGY